MPSIKPWKPLTAALLAALLAACGGGGGGDSTAATQATPVTLTQEPGAPVLTGNTATDGYNWINYRRAQAGLPVLARNSLLDSAAQAHSDYQKLNNIVSHDEIAGKPGFTGAELAQRFASAGYVLGTDSYAYGEVISAATSTSGFYLSEQLITAIYHRFVMFEPLFRENGSGAATAAGGYTYFTSDFAARGGYGPGLGRGNIVVYPFAGQLKVAPNFMSDSETPDPVPDRNEVGYPISVHADLDSDLNVAVFTVRAHGAASDLPVRRLSHDTDAAETPASAAAIVPLAALSPNTVYDVTFSGRAGGIDVTRNWSFTTR